ncbi:MAG TPA: hypothetical protein VH724_08300 [Candidatus Angelobacter sp.]|nr:hypothetical protein [Candidatus Angelobacter sp.]
MEDSVKYLVDHYQKTYELTFTLWEGRNKTFLVLLGVVGVAPLVTFPALGARSLVFLYLGHMLGLKDDDVHSLQNGFPQRVLQAIILFVILYLTVNLYHRARYVLRNYAYLSALESEIRQTLSLREGAVAFTRESTFYWGQRDFLSGAVKYVYIVLLAGLLLTFLGVLTVADWKNGNHVLSLVDLIFAVPTLIFVFGFANSSVSMDRKHAIVVEPQAAARGANK